MLHKIKLELFSLLQSQYKEFDFSINDIEVITLFDKKGDFTSNICMKFSKILNSKPNDIAKNIIKNFSLDGIIKIEVAGPGFLNFFISDKSFINLLSEKSKTIIDNSSVNIEFVSANPTGPLHLAHGRGAVVGDVLSNLYKYFGHKVTREYYVNNTGNQIKEFLHSIIFNIAEKHNLNLNYVKLWEYFAKRNSNVI